MLVRELIERLQEYCEDAEVRLATQPSWPLQATLAGVAGSEDQSDYDELEIAPGSIVWLVEGSQCYDDPYAPKWVFGVAS